MALRKESPLPQFKVASYKHLRIRLSFEDPTTLLPGGGGGKNCSGTKFRKNAPQVCNFLNSFVQDCSSRVKRKSFYRKSELLMFLFICGGHIGGQNMASPQKALQMCVKCFGK